MEKTTKKKRKKSKSLKRRIGIIAVGGLSFVLTVCLSVGATLAWFAGSSWASQDLYMGGPVYVEMTGADNQYKAGNGNLDIKVAAARETGTVYDSSIGEDDPEYINPDVVLLPGQKVAISSSARVFSTAQTSTVAANPIPNQSSGANTSNTSNGTTEYRNADGRVTTTTTSVLRARFSINVEFDPSVGFNQFTDIDYVTDYPKQSTNYTGGRYNAFGAGTDGVGGELATSAATDAETKPNLWYETARTGADTTDADYVLPWQTAMSTSTTSYVMNHDTKVGRRDGVAYSTTAGAVNFTNVLETNSTGTAPNITYDSTGGLWDLKNGSAKSIYKWTYCSPKDYEEAADQLIETASGSGIYYAADEAGEAVAATTKYCKMGYPFNGGDTSTNANGYYGVWELVSDGATSGAKAVLSESDAFFNARKNAYLESYVEFYVNEYGKTVKRTIKESIDALDKQLNKYFVQLVNDSSDSIITSLVGTGEGTETATASGFSTGGTVGTGASWLYLDPTIGNDTNTNEISTSTGGWWYLVACDKGSVGTNAAAGNKITTVTEDSTKDKSAGQYAYSYSTALTRAAGEKDENRKNALLYEIKDFNVLSDVIGYNNGEPIYKTASDLFPFVNGSFPLPTDALTNVFANAKISFQISFQALQAFFPFTETIDDIDYKNPLLGTAKALTIGNAIPIYNEAFDYQENTDSTIEGL